MSLNYSKSRISSRDIQSLETEEILISKAIKSSNNPWEKEYLENKSKQIKQRINLLLNNFQNEARTIYSWWTN